MRDALLAVLVACVCMVSVACGGESKPPMQPDNDLTSLGDGGAEPAAPASSAH
jgi:hypothetical protein